MGKNDDRKHVHDLAVFALKVLEVLEQHDVWDFATAKRMADRACASGFADRGASDGSRNFHRTNRGRGFKDTWYGSSSNDEEAPRVGDHVERDLY